MAAHWAAASGHDSTLELLLADDPHALLMEDERQMVPAAVAARDGHPWLQGALEKLLTEERVVCVRVHREATMQRPLGAAAAGRGGDAAHAEAPRIDEGAGEPRDR